MPDKSIRASFGDILCSLAAKDKNIYVVDADLKSPLSLKKFALKYPSRFIEAGVAENNAAGIAAGLAKTGKTVFLTSFACFSPAINWNTIKQSICYNHANVKIIGSHAGLMSSDLGATHQMLEDIALMRSLPNMQVFAPADSLETEQIITTVSRSHLPSYVRLVRPATPVFTSPKTRFTIGTSHILKKGSDITIVSYGPLLSYVLKAQAQLALELGSKAPSLEIINCSSIKPLDFKTISESVVKTKKLIVYEDHQKHAGLGEAISSLLLENSCYPKYLHLAVDNQFGQSGKDYHELYRHYGLGIDNLVISIKNLCQI